jgi:ParB family chromosome partitioning protein
VVKRRTGLGKGINALISTDLPIQGEETDDQEKNDRALIVDIDSVYPNPDQPRTHFDEDALSELSESIKQNGLLQPILVREVDGEYQIIAGERRWQACKKLGLEKVAVNVTEADDSRSLTLAMIENIQRSDLNPMEEAYGYRMLMERENLTQAKLAEVVSKGRSTIANSLRLLDLPEDAQRLLLDSKITAGHARAILSIPTEEGRALLTKKLVEEDLTVREAENLARLYAGRKSEAPKRAATPKSFKKVAKSLRNALGTNVRVKTVGGKNKIEIEFRDEEELQELFKKMVEGK